MLCAIKAPLCPTLLSEPLKAVVMPASSPGSVFIRSKFLLGTICVPCVAASVLGYKNLVTPQEVSKKEPRSAGIEVRNVDFKAQDARLSTSNLHTLQNSSFGKLNTGSCGGEKRHVLESSDEEMRLRENPRQGLHKHTVL